MTKTLRTFLGLVLIGAMAGAQTWDATKPANDSNALTADVRSNWTSLAQSVGGVNLIADPTFLIWPAGDAAAPTHYTLSGAGAAIARTGTGLGDTNRKAGEFAALITSGGGAAGILEQQLLPTAGFTRADFLKGQTVSCGAWMRGTGATSIRLGIYDGAGTSYSDYGANGSWSWVTKTRTIDNAATLLAIRAEVGAGTLSGYVSGITCLLGPVPPAYFQPAPVTMLEYACHIPGTLTTGINQCFWTIFRPGIVKDVVLYTGTSPTGADLIVDVNTWDGAAYTSMFTAGGRPRITAGGAFGSARPDTTYARRCITFGGVGTFLTIDIDQIGSTVAGGNLNMGVHVLQFARPLEAFLDYSDVR